MPAQHTLHVALTEPLLKYISEQVASGRYATASEVVRASLRLLIAATAVPTCPQSALDARGPSVQALPGGRLQLQHGPIDVVLRAWGARDAVAAAYDAAAARLRTMLGELVEELPELRKPMGDGPRVEGAVAKRMAPPASRTAACSSRPWRPSRAPSRTSSWPR